MNTHPFVRTLACAGLALALVAPSAPEAAESRYETLFLAFPSLGPASGAQTTETGWHDQVQVTVQEYVPIVGPDDIFAQRLRGQPKEERKEDDDVPGCKGYLSGNWREDVYLCRQDPDKGDIVATCSRKDAAVIYPACNVHRTIVGDLTVNYWFARPHLGEIVRLDDAVRTEALRWARTHARHVD